MSSDAKPEPLRPIAYDGVTNTDLDSEVVTDFTKLASALQSLNHSADGQRRDHCRQALRHRLGADGGHVSSITVDGITYTPDTSLGTLTASGGTSAAYLKRRDQRDPRADRHRRRPGARC